MKKLIALALLFTLSTVAFSQKRIPRTKTVEEKLNEEYCTGMFKTNEGTYFDMLNDTRTESAVSYLNILDWLQGRVAGLQIYTRRDNTPIPFIRGNRAGIYVDEIYRDAESLSAIPISDIAMIKIIKGPFLGGFNCPGGAIAIYTIGTEEDEEED